MKETNRFARMLTSFSILVFYWELKQIIFILVISVFGLILWKWIIPLSLSDFRYRNLLLRLSNFFVFVGDLLVRSLSLSLFISCLSHIAFSSERGGNGFVLYAETGQKNLLNDSLFMFFFCYWISDGKSSVIRRKDLYRNATERNVKPSTKVNVICIPSFFFGGQREEVVGRWTSWTGWFSPV